MLSGNQRRALRVGLLTFFLSVSFSTFFQFAHTATVYWISALLLLLVIFLGIVFDLIGTATTAASEEPFHAMASDRVVGAKRAIQLVRNADRVANFCNDVIGDICGTVSGSIGAALVIDFVVNYQVPQYRNLLSILIVGLVSALTVGGKAAGKSFAIKKSSVIVWRVAFLLEKMEQIKNRGTKDGKNKKARR